MNPINSALISNGWKVWPDSYRRDHVTFFAQSFGGHAECRGNRGKPKQIEIYHHHAQSISGLYLHESWAVECTGEMPDGEWIRMQVQSLTDLDTINRTVTLLLTLWDQACQITPTIEEPDL